MRIAQVSPLYESVPPKLYGGTERVVSWLTEELVRAEHDVTLFASGDSETTANLVPAGERSLWRDTACRETLPQHVRLMDLVFSKAHEFDIIHFHTDYLHFPLRYLASTQATEVNAAADAEPGKILHEARNGEMAALGEMPFARYYGTVDATPLFVVLAGAYYERTGDLRLIEGLWKNIQAALLWMDRHGDRDGDGFLEYHRQSTDGLLHQAWKDSDDAIFHSDGTLAVGPIAVCEVQGYVYAAWRAAATMAAALGETGQAQDFTSRAVPLRARFERQFWCEELSTYGLALDRDKRLCRVRASNAGQCLFAGIATPDRAARVAQTLLEPESFSGWGIRSVAASERRYNPMGYHTGCVWPHDNALIGYGFARYGLCEAALRVFAGLFDSGMYFDLHRMPELFCGFPRDPGEGPVLYPFACAPQAWSAGSVFLLFQACLGLRVMGAKPQISFTRPALPSFLTEARIVKLQVGSAAVDLLLTRHDHGVGVTVLRRKGEVEIVAVM